MEATEKFTGKAEVYAKYRPGYPKEYIDYLIKINNLSKDSVVADIGSGTGILTKQLLDRNLRVIGVEPNNEMRNASKDLLKQFNAFISVNATAENTTLANNSIDLITVAQAFHWFDKVKFKKECKRILKPNSNVALVWNSRDFKSKLVLENSDICRRFCTEFIGFSGGYEQTPKAFDLFFRNEEYEYKEFDNKLIFDLDGFIGRNLSASYAPKPDEPEFFRFIDAITELFYKYCKDDKLIMPNITKSYIGNI